MTFRTNERTNRGGGVTLSPEVATSAGICVVQVPILTAQLFRNSLICCYSYFFPRFYRLKSRSPSFSHISHHIIKTKSAIALLLSDVVRSIRTNRTTFRSFVLACRATAFRTNERTNVRRPILLGAEYDGVIA